MAEILAAATMTAKSNVCAAYGWTLMSALGHKRTCRRPLISDFVRYYPKADKLGPNLESPLSAASGHRAAPTRPNPRMDAVLGGCPDTDQFRSPHTKPRQRRAARLHRP